MSRRWLSALEAGKPTAEIGLVLDLMRAMDLAMEVNPRAALPDDIDLDDVLRRHTGPVASDDG